MKIAISTDTTSGMTKEQADKLGVFLLHLPVTINGQVFYEGRDIAYEDFYSYLTEENEVVTSQPSPGDLINHLDNIFDKGFDQVIHIPLSSAFSSSLQTAKLVAENYDGRVFVCDNHRISVAQIHGIKSALSLVEEGLAADDIVKRLEDPACNSEIYVGFETLEYLKQGGRIALTAVAGVSGLFNVIPVITLKDDRPTDIEIARGPKQSKKKILARIKKTIGKIGPNLDDYYINSGGTFKDPERAKEWNDLVKEVFDGVDVEYQYLSSTVATHAGPDAYGFAISKK